MQDGIFLQCFLPACSPLVLLLGPSSASINYLHKYLYSRSATGLRENHSISLSLFYFVHFFTPFSNNKKKAISVFCPGSFILCVRTCVCVEGQLGDRSSFDLAHVRLAFTRTIPFIPFQCTQCRGLFLQVTQQVICDCG